MHPFLTGLYFIYLRPAFYILHNNIQQVRTFEISVLKIGKQKRQTMDIGKYYIGTYLGKKEIPS